MLIPVRLSDRKLKLNGISCFKFYTFFLLSLIPEGYGNGASTTKKKQPSPVANPANKFGSGIFCACAVTRGLFNLVTSGKADVSSGDRPKLSEPFIATNLYRPSCCAEQIMFFVYYYIICQLEESIVCDFFCY